MSEVHQPPAARLVHQDGVNDAQGDRRLRGLIDTLAAFVGLTTLDGTLVEANRAALEAAGLTPQDVLGKPFWEAHWWSYDPSVQAQLQRAIARAAAGEVVQYDVPIRALAGELIIEFRIAPLRDDAGHITHLVPSAVNITDRVRLERDLRERETQLRAALQVARMGTFDLDTESMLVQASETTREFFQAAGTGLLPLDAYLAHVHPDDRDRVVAAVAHAIETGEGHEHEYRVLGSDGSVRWLLSRADILPAHEGHPARLVGALIDISERKAGEALFARQFADLEAIYTGAPVGLCVLDRELRFVRINTRMAEINGLPAAAHLGRTVRQVVPALGDAAETLLRRVLETGEPVLDAEVTGETPALPGVERTWIENWHPVRGPDDEIIGVNIVTLEVTDRVAAERALREHKEHLEQRVQARTQQVRQLAATLSRAEQSERARVAQVLHDEVQQLLYALKIQVKLVNASSDVHEIHEHLADAHHTLQQAIDSTRRLTLTMNPPVLREEGLAAAFRWLAAEMSESYPLDVKLHLALEEGDPLSIDERALVLHTVRELLFNVVKHAGVDCAELHAAIRDEELVVEVRDHGAGFEPAEVLARKSRNFGLGNIRERLQLNGGGLDFTTKPGNGTRAVIRLPLEL